jgi:hypothetical protein
MRAFEFLSGELFDRRVQVMIVDLDSIVRFQAGNFSPAPTWLVSFSDGTEMAMTKAAFDRVLLAWKSK